MNKTMVWLLSIVVALGISTLAIALFPKGQPDVGLVSGHLRPCPNTPNCVCSEDSAVSATIAPFVFDGSAESAWQRIKETVVSVGGDIQKEEDGYLWATFTTKWLRFVDDMELRLDAENYVIHVRSASRVGRSDFGVNRKRVESLRARFRSLTTAE